MRIAVLGLGSIGSRHANNLVGLGHEVIAYDPVEFRTYNGKTTLLNNRRDLFYTDGIKAAVICSPTYEHQKDLFDCIKKGWHTFIEKPIANITPEIADLHTIASYASIGNLRCMVGYNQRFHPAVIELKKRISEIGEPLWGQFICAQRSIKPAYLKDSVIFNWSHEIDLALHLLGPAEVETVSKGPYLADICLKHHNGALSTVHLDYLTSPEIRTTTVVGDLGHSQINLPERTIDFVREQYSQNNFKQFPGSYDGDYLSEIKEFINYVETGTLNCGCTLDEALEVWKICDQAERRI